MRVVIFKAFILHSADLVETIDTLLQLTGGSMRISDMAELMAGYKREGIPAEPYYWFSDQRKYGTTEHGGYGLGVEVGPARLFHTAR